MADRGGVEIDYCPKCRGVWLDRGELDKIIERASATAAPVAPPAPAAPTYAAPPQQVPHGYRPDDDYRYKKKRKDFFSDLFDF
jgi:Zn-finger nucleic acid-binding protein